MTDREHWVPFMIRLAFAEERPDGTRRSIREAELRVRDVIESEGGRVAEFFWHEPFAGRNTGASELRLVAIFDARSQYPVLYDVPSYEKYIHPPLSSGDEEPEALGPEEMAEAICRRLHESGGTIVIELQHWMRNDDFHDEMHEHGEIPRGRPGYWAYVETTHLHGTEGESP